MNSLIITKIFSIYIYTENRPQGVGEDHFVLVRISEHLHLSLTLSTLGKFFSRRYIGDSFFLLFPENRISADYISFPLGSLGPSGCIGNRGSYTSGHFI